MKSQRTQGRHRALLSSLALLASTLVLGLVPSVSAASESAPENTSAPTLAPTSPYVAWAVQGKVGTWNGEPTSYAYAWERCGSECAVISGATASSYTPTSVDVGNTLRLAVTATNAYGSTTAYSSQSGTVAKSLNWYENNGSWLHLGASTAFSSALTEYGMRVKYPYLGATVEIQCSGLKGGGTLTNQESGSQINGYNLEPQWCTVAVPAGKGCYLDGYTIHFNTLEGTLTNPASLKSELKFVPASGSTIAEFEMKGCQGSEALEAFNRKYSFTGWFPAKFENSGPWLHMDFLEMKNSGGFKLNGTNWAGITAYSTFASEGGHPVKLDTGP